MILNLTLGSLAFLSLALLIWQWWAARRFPLHQRVAGRTFAPAVTLLKPLKGCDAATEACLRSWMTQDYTGPVQVLFGVSSETDPVCELVRRLLQDFPNADAQLIVCSGMKGANAKVAKLADLEPLAKHDVLVVSDADVRVPPDFLVNAVAPLAPGFDSHTGSARGSFSLRSIPTEDRHAEYGGQPDSFPKHTLETPAPVEQSVAAIARSKGVKDFSEPPKSTRQRRVLPETSEPGTPEVGLVNCFYRLANPATLAMYWESVAINADFWSQVLQSQTLKPLDFGLGAAMVTRREHLSGIGGFAALADCLADDYQLGNRMARQGLRIVLCPVVVECWDPPQGWRAVWNHQLRWARTIRVCRPVPYFFSILSNAGLWALLWLGVCLAQMGIRIEESSIGHFLSVELILSRVAFVAAGFVAVRMLLAVDLQRRLTRSLLPAAFLWMVPIKDLLQVAIWFLAFAGNRIEWRGQRYRLAHDGTLIRL